MSLTLLEFIKDCILFAEDRYRHPLDYKTEIKPGITTVNFNGLEYCAVAQETAGWTWVVTAGRIPRPNPPVLFDWESPIYRAKRYDRPIPLDITKLDKGGEISGTTNRAKDTSTVVSVPQELQHPVAAWEYIEQHNYEKQPDLEYYIAKSPRFAYMYALKVLHGRFFKFNAEDIIASSEWSYWYAVNIIKGRWAKAEPAIARISQLRDMYCKAFNLTYDSVSKTFR